MSRVVHVRFYEGLGVRFPRATRLVIGFLSHHEAQACLVTLRTRLAKFGLKLHEGETRLIEFGRYAIENRQRHGDGRPEVFDSSWLHAFLLEDESAWSVSWRGPNSYGS